MPILPPSPAPMSIAFILVEPARAENIGAAARAIKTMGFNELWIINQPKISKEAYWLAHQSGDILDNARHFESLEAALQEVDFSVATGARRRLSRNIYLHPDQCAQQIQQKQGYLRRAAMVFGRESSGLTTDEMGLCDIASTVPLAVEQPSLNLAQAVMLYAWEINQALVTGAGTAGHRGSEDGKQNATDSNVQTYRQLQQQLHQLLDHLKFGANDNIRGWLDETLAQADSRSLGLIFSVLSRLRQRQ